MKTSNIVYKQNADLDALDFVVGVRLSTGALHFIRSDEHTRQIADAIKQLGDELKIYLTYKPKNFFLKVAKHHSITKEDVDLIIAFITFHQSIGGVNISCIESQIEKNSVVRLNKFFASTSSNIALCDFALLDEVSKRVIHNKNAAIKTTGVVEFKLVMHSENGRVEIHKNWPYVVHFGGLIHTYFSAGQEHVLNSLRCFEIDISIDTGISIDLRESMRKIAELLLVCPVLKSFKLCCNHQTSIFHHVQIDEEHLNKAIISHKSVSHAFYPGISHLAKEALKNRDERDHMTNFLTY